MVATPLARVLGWKLGFSGETLVLQPSLQPQYLVFITVMRTQWALSVWKLMVFSVLEIYFRIYVFKIPSMSSALISGLLPGLSQMFALIQL